MSSVIPAPFKYWKYLSRHPFSLRSVYLPSFGVIHCRFGLDSFELLNLFNFVTFFRVFTDYTKTAYNISQVFLVIGMDSILFGVIPSVWISTETILTVKNENWPLLFCSFLVS